MNLPTIKQLRYFLALEKHGHFGKAAESSFVSQSAFSVAIRELESTLGAQLFDRTNKSVTITSMGQEIVVQARLVVRDLEALMNMAQVSSQPLSGKLMLGVIPTISPFLLPKILPKLRSDFPQLRLFLQEDTTQRVYEKLMNGELDLILIAFPYELRNVEKMKLFKDQFLLAYKKDSQFIVSQKITVEHLQSESILLLEDGHCLRDHALSACKIRNLNKVSHFAASSLLTLIEMVEADLGVTYLPEMAKDSPLLKNTNIKTQVLPKSSHREIGLIWRKGSARSKEFKMLGEFIQKHRNIKN
ncbi:MAG: LysR family hydrogen peroxide-inducible transcriptional activator [Gammaproteobacteria bacterium]|jgi:LysR family hydrogen peroxide-inducible transcriptional activator